MNSISQNTVSAVPTRRRSYRKSYPPGIPNGRQRATLDCGRCDSRWQDNQHRVCGAGRGYAADNRLGRGQSDDRSVRSAVAAGVNMARAKMKQVVIPKFSSEAEEAAWWDIHRPDIEAEIRKRIKKKKPLTLSNLLRGANPSQPVTLRVSQEDLETARRLAARRGLGYQTYMKMLLRNALSEDSAEGVVNDLCSYAEVQTGFQYWSNAESLSPTTQTAIRRSDIVLVPAEGFADYKGPVFPKGTDELFRLD